MVSIVFPRGIRINTATPEIDIIPAPTPTVISGIQNPDVTQTPEVSEEIDGIRKGVYVQVNGTGGTGLRLRSNPGSAGDTLALASDDEVFLVIDGPQKVDEIIWWKLQAPYQSAREGWGAAEYLSVIAIPTPE